VTFHFLVQPVGMGWLAKDGGEKFNGQKDSTLGIFTLYLAKAMPDLTTSGNIHTLVHT
jgi:hypothetical protein